MNYIRELNAFYDWLETNSISDSAIALWHALMHINNKAGWITEFAVALSTLETKTGLKKDAIIRARHRLQQLSRINFRSRSGQQSAIYSIVPFDCVAKTETNCDTNRNTNRELTATLTATQTASIIKLNETKQKEKDIIPYAEIVGHLNAVCDTKFKPSTKTTKSHISARWADGYRLDDFKAVIDTKAREWLNDPAMSQYLRPETLFGTKFESYLNQKNQKGGQARASNQQRNKPPVDDWDEEKFYTTRPET